MAICDWCKQEMLIAHGCSENPVVEYPDGEERASIAYDAPAGVLNCHDCGVLDGYAHHPGCAREICPRCDGQLISCGCLDSPEDDPATVWH